MRKKQECKELCHEPAESWWDWTGWQTMGNIEWVSAPDFLIRKKQQIVRPFPDKPKKSLLHWPWSSWEPLAMLISPGGGNTAGKSNAGFCRAMMTVS